MSTPTGAAVAPRPSGWRIWLAGARPKTLVAGAAPVLIGTALAMARPGFKPLAAALALVGALALQAGANLVNDAGDGQAGIDDTERVGPPRLVQQGLATARSVWIAAAIVFGVGAAAGLGLIALGGWPVLAIGLAALVAAIGYTAGPAPLGRLGLGELSAFVFFGPVAVCGTVGAATGDWNHLPLLWGLPTGLLAGALMLSNNLRDRQTDSRAGKRTIAVRWPKGARWLFRGCLVGSILTPAVVAATTLNFALCIAVGLMVPKIIPTIVTEAESQTGRELAPLLGRVVDLLMVGALAITGALVYTHLSTGP